MDNRQNKKLDLGLAVEQVRNASLPADGFSMPECNMPADGMQIPNYNRNIMHTAHQVPHPTNDKAKHVDAAKVMNQTRHAK